MSVESTYPSRRVLSEVKFPSNLRPAIPIASAPFLAGGGLSTAMSKSVPLKSPTRPGSCPRDELRTSKVLGGRGWGVPLNFFGGTRSAGREWIAEKVQDAPPPTR